MLITHYILYALYNVLQLDYTYKKILSISDNYALLKLIRLSVIEGNICHYKAWPRSTNDNGIQYDGLSRPPGYVVLNSYGTRRGAS